MENNIFKKKNVYTYITASHCSIAEMNTTL